MHKRTQIEIHLNKEERDLLFDFFKYCKSFSRTSQLANFLLWRKNSDKRVNYKIIARWLRREDLLTVEKILREKEQEREGIKKEPKPSLKELILIKRRI